MSTDDPFEAPVPREVTPRAGQVYDENTPTAMPPRENDGRGKLRDFDTSESAFKLKTFTWSGTGGVMGMFLGLLISVRTGGSPTNHVFAMAAGFILGWVIVYVGASGMASAAGRGGAAIYMPSGSTTPMDRQYSLAQSFVVRGRFADAAAEYERAAAAFPEDPEPCMRLARLYRDNLQQFENAITWFKRTSAIPNLPPGTEMMALRELCEVYTHRLRTPAAALPHMARLAARHPNTPAGDWARREIPEIKAQLREST